jgi:hypothetical protein
MSAPTSALAPDLPPDVWALLAENKGVGGAWQLMRVCKASRAGAKQFLSTLPGLVVCGGIGGGNVSWRLDLATMRWEPMPSLVTGRCMHACCAVRGTLVVLGGQTAGGDGRTSSVEMLSSSGGAFVGLPPLSRGGISAVAAIAVGENESAAGQVLLLGGRDDSSVLSTVQLVDLATGKCVQRCVVLLDARDVVLLDVCDAAIRPIFDTWDDRYFTVGPCRLNKVDP